MTLHAPGETAVAESLNRRVGFAGFLGIGINISVGGSIFLIGGEAFRLAGNWSLIVAAGMGLFALGVAFILAETSSRFISTGGPYVQVRSAFGDFLGFEVGWLMWFSRVLAFATLTNAAVTSGAYFLGGEPNAWAHAAAIFAITGAIAAVHLSGIRESIAVIGAFAVMKVAALILLIGLAVSAGHIELPEMGPTPPTTDLVTCALLLVFTFSGFEVIPVTAGEGRNPRRDVPLAILISVCAMVGFWLLVQCIQIATLPGLAQESRPAAAAAGVLGGPIAGMIVTAGAIAAAIGTCVGVLLSASRSLYVLGEDGLVPPWFGQVQTGTAVPARAILLSTGVAAALALSGTFVYLAAASALPRLFVFFMLAASLIRFRRQDGDGVVPAPRFRIGRVGVPLAIVLMSAIVLVVLGMSASQHLFGIGAFVIGALLFLLRNRR